jgi:hypothetical protein
VPALCGVWQPAICGAGPRCGDTSCGFDTSGTGRAFSAARLVSAAGGFFVVRLRVLRSSAAPLPGALPPDPVGPEGASSSNAGRADECGPELAGAGRAGRSVGVGSSAGVDVSGACRSRPGAGNHAHVRHEQHSRHASRTATRACSTATRACPMGLADSHARVRTTDRHARVHRVAERAKEFAPPLADSHAAASRPGARAPQLHAHASATAAHAHPDRKPRACATAARSRHRQRQRQRTRAPHPAPTPQPQTATRPPHPTALPEPPNCPYPTGIRSRTPTQTASDPAPYADGI